MLSTIRQSPSADPERRHAAGRPRSASGRSQWTALVVCVGLLAIAQSAAAISFQVDFASTTYQVQGGDTYADLLLEHQTSPLLTANTLTSLLNVSAPALAGTNADYSTLIRGTFVAAQTGSFEFQVGADWGRGGVAYVYDDTNGVVLDEYVTTGNLWWNNNWTDADVFSSTVNLVAGNSYTLSWIGFEDCCGGVMSYRFAFNGGPQTTLNNLTFAPYEAVAPIPEPHTALLTSLGLFGLGFAGRRRSA